MIGMKTLYLDIFSGISGDMFLGAMIDLGLELPKLERELAKLKLTGYHLHARRQQNANIEGIKFDVHLEEDGAHGHTHARGHGHEHDEHHHHHGHEHGHAHGHSHSHDHDHDHEHHHHHDDHEHHHLAEHEHGRDFATIKQLIDLSSLSDWVKDKAKAVFHRVAIAEGKVHGQPPEQVHFHEVGAIDSIVDIVGACIALELLGRPRVLAAAVVEGTGWVNCQHGRFPVPTTATLEILGARGIAVTQCEEPHELVTPTGAALLAEFVETFGPMHGLVAQKIGYGLGTRQNKTRPNVLRAVLASHSAALPAPVVGSSEARDWETDFVTVLETNIDDCPGEILGYVIERALASGALDVFHTPIQMKKNRPGVLLTILCRPEQADDFSAMLLTETSAFGVRRSNAERRKLPRAFVKAKTPFGEVSLKLGKLNGKLIQASPEFESCRSLAAQAKVPLREIYAAAEEAARLFKANSQ